MAYNADIATALSMAPQLGTLSASTTPTSTAAGVIWAQQYARVRAALLAARLSDTVTGVALVRAQEAEGFLTSGFVLRAKGSVGKAADSTAQALIDEGKALLGRFAQDRLSLLGAGATALDASPTHFVRSQQIDDADPDFDRTPGTGDIDYARNDVWPQDGEET